MNFESVTIVVQDMKKSLEFYKDVLGFSVVSESKAFSKLALDGFKLNLHIANDYMKPSSGVIFNFHCSNLHEKYEQLKSRGINISPPRVEEGMSGESSSLEDPNGSTILLLA